MHRLRHRADRDGLRRQHWVHHQHHHHRDGHGNHRHPPGLRHRRHRRRRDRRCGSYHRRRRRGGHPDRDRDARRRRDGGRRDDRAHRDGPPADAAACCRGWRRRDAERRPDAAAYRRGRAGAHRDQPVPVAWASPDARRAGPRRTGCCRPGAVAAVRAWEPPDRVADRLPQAAPARVRLRERQRGRRPRWAAPERGAPVGQAERGARAEPTVPARPAWERVVRWRPLRRRPPPWRGPVFRAPSRTPSRHRRIRATAAPPGLRLWTMPI